MFDVSKTPLMQFLGTYEPDYLAKARELRTVMERWQEYVVTTFPHYTGHTVRHSDEIISQISKILFEDDDPERPTITLSSVEAYICVVSAYLHDAGMVVSEKEKLETFAAADWKEWLAAPENSERWETIERFRAGDDPADAAERNYIADSQVRILMSEYLRLRHHLRSGIFLSQHQAQLGRFAYDDPILLRTINDVCVSHGLDRTDLEDLSRFPSQRDILGEKADVRFLALMLRIGDLLDLSSDRACPLLLNAASPLPADSFAHWSQYQRIVHRSTDPSAIEIEASCETQEEHRYLQDWCEWLVSEVRTAAILMATSKRHVSWAAPVASIDGATPTIVIHPSSSARYVPSRWQFELEPRAIFERFIFDVYDEPLAFIRELLQNALDATRCAMYLELRSTGGGLDPEYPTQIDLALREKYAVKVQLSTKTVINELTGASEQRQVISVDDAGIGMTRHTIERYLLQVGRSFYESAEFRQRFGFVPTSRFGVGFLSVFAVSDDVRVETRSVGATDADGSIRMRLTGPRSYLLTDVGTRRRQGTEVEVVLRDAVDEAIVRSAISTWCRRVEVPVIVESAKDVSVLRSEEPRDFVYAVPDMSDEGASFVLKSFPSTIAGIEGEFYVVAHVLGDGTESWSDWSWARYSYPQQFPGATPPAVPGNLICLHGIAIDHGGYQSAPYSARLDYRKSGARMTLARSRRTGYSEQPDDFGEAVRARWHEIVVEHLRQSPLAAGSTGWVYKQRLSRFFEFRSLWRHEPEFIEMWENKRLTRMSVEEMADAPVVSLVSRPRFYDRGMQESEERSEDDAIVGTLAESDIEVPVCRPFVLRRMSEVAASIMFEGRQISRAFVLADGVLALRWEFDVPGAEILGLRWHRDVQLTALPSHLVGIEIHPTRREPGGQLLLNGSHPTVVWLARIREACERGTNGLSGELWDVVADLVENAIKYPSRCDALRAYVERWQERTDLPEELMPPNETLTQAMFGFAPNPWATP